MSALPEFLTNALAVPREAAFNERLGGTAWTRSSTTAMLARARAIAVAIRRSGVGRGDRVALISENRLDWVAADFGILLAGCVVVPMFASQAPDQLEYIFKDCGAKLAFVEDAHERDRIAATCPSFPRAIVFDAAGAESGASLAAFEAEGAAHVDEGELAGYTSGVGDDELAVLIYTSGTTGNPKGVMLSHDNLVWTVKTAGDIVFDLIGESGDPTISVLPFAHIYEHTNLLAGLRRGYSIHLSQPDYLIADLKDVRPVTVALVPRIFERVLAAILASAKAGGGVKAKLVPWALAAGREFASHVAAGTPVPLPLRAQYALAQRLVFAKIKPALGLDRVVALISGSAPLHRDISLTFSALGMPVMEGYGLTETSPVVSLSTQARHRYGSVGFVLPGVQVRLAADNEIEVKGRNVMKGYYHLPDERPFTDDGWLLTGDIGELDADGFLFITDRKKELIKTTTGKYVAPGRVEASIKRSIYVGQAFVIGDGRPFPIALVAPNWELVRRDFGIPVDVATETIARRDDVRTLLEKEVTAFTNDLASFEQVRKVALLPRDLTIEDGELSPTLKVKRRIVTQKFESLIESVYTGRPIAEGRTAASTRA